MTETSSTSTTSMDMSSVQNELDLAFIIDATASMTSYIRSVQQNIQKIIQDIKLNEKCLLNVALILYRDHPPQDQGFIVQMNDFTNGQEIEKMHIDAAVIRKGGDTPEAMAPALHAAVHDLSWRQHAIKIALLITDAPPHGLTSNVRDNWPDGDPSGHDPIECVTVLAERSVTLYTIGCEPAAKPYRHFFMALAFKTGGQYVPLASSGNLASVIVGSAQEEVSLERLLTQVHEEVMREAAQRGGPVDETELTRRIHEVMSGDVKASRLKMNNQDGTTNIPALTSIAEQLSKLNTLKDVQENWIHYTDPITTITTPTIQATCSSLDYPKTIVTTPHQSTSIISTVTSTSTPITKNKIASKKRKLSPLRKTIMEKRRRRSGRLAFNRRDEQKLNDIEPIDTSKTTVIVEVKTTTDISPAKVKYDDLLDISQTRRVVRKCVARNKLKST